ncbi:MAG: PorT family protein [Flavobacteriales bacterium]|nr:PorT family protein [Flavobacteriales bacterium]
MTRNRTAIFIILLLTTVLGGRQAFGQKRIVTQNLQNFDLRPLHFGFLLGYNTSDFFLKLKPNAPFTDSIQVVDHIRQPGFNLGIVTSFNMTPNLSLRFIPTLSFQDRVLSYRFKKSDGKTITFDKPVESTWLEFPVLLKMRSDRINNFAVYVIAGGKFSIDMASQKDVNQELDEESVVKLVKNDYSAEVGGGADMFLPYFKFGMELKMGIGIPNLLIDDGTRFSTPLQSLRSKTWMFTLTFEG